MKCRIRSPQPLRRFLVGLALVLSCANCSSETEEARPSVPHARMSSPDDPALAARAEDPRPSVLLIVLDTTRADAVSAYGAVEGTTPTLDALAAGGTRFARAFAPSPWTVSSHASLFSGLRVDEHGVGLDGAFVSPDELEMLAETFGEAGYETAGFAENSLVSADFGFEQGFGHFEVTRMLDVVKAEAAGEYSMSFFGLARKIRSWARSRDASRPYFVFVNIMDAHDPYVVRDANPWVPADTARSELEFVVRKHPIPTALCRKAPPRRDQAILRGLYLGDVAAADSKLKRVLAALPENSPAEKRITIVTADHGEHLGEHDLSGHRFSVRTPALHIPLVVHGVPSLAPGVVEAPVELRSVKQSLVCWGLAGGCPAELEEAASESGADGTDAKTPPIFGIYSDRSAEVPGPIRDQLGFSPDRVVVDHSRAACEKDDRVFGDLVSLIRYPFKINWFDGRAPTLHDLSWDPWERSDVLANQPEVAAPLSAELRDFVERRIKNRSAGDPVPTLSEDAVRALESLGYVE